MKIQPLNKNVVVERKLVEEKSPGGLFIPGNAQEKPTQGVVRGVGPKVTDVTEGDTVMFAKFAGQEIDGTDLVVLKEEDLIGIVEP